MNLSPYLANKLARWFAAQAMPSAPAALYVGLWDGDPLDGGSEVGGDILDDTPARIEISVATPANDGEDNVLVSDADADFGASQSATPVSVTHIAIHDADTAGNILAIKALDTPRTVNETDEVKVASGDFTLTVTKYEP